MISGYRRVAQAFHAKNFCDSRIYEYCIPTYVFKRQHIDQDLLDQIAAALVLEPEEKIVPGPPTFRARDKTQPQQQEQRQKNQRKRGKGNEGSGDEDDSDGGEDVDPDEESDKVEDTEQELEERMKYRLPQEDLAFLTELLKKFEGTHNFHNFTSGKKFSEPSAKRFIIWFKVRHSRPSFADFFLFS